MENNVSEYERDWWANPYQDRFLDDVEPVPVQYGGVENAKPTKVKDDQTD